MHLLFKNNFLPYWVLLVTTLLMGCKKEQNGNSGPQAPEVSSRAECKLFMSYEVETTRMMKVLNDADLSLLTPMEKTLMLPQREKMKVEACLKPDGQKTVIMTRMTPDNPIVYPDSAILAYLAPNYSKAIYTNTGVTYYDQFDQVMSVSPYAFDPASIQRLLDMVPSGPPMSNQKFEAAVKILKDNSGGKVQEHADNLFSVRTDLPDGAFSIQVIDKTTRIAIGNIHYDNNGALLSRSMYAVSGDAAAPILERCLFESRTTSIETQVPMKFEQHDKFTNFIIEYN